DNGGIEINSDKKIVLTAKDDIEITGGARILLQGDAGIDLKQADANLNIADHVTLSGGKSISNEPGDDERRSAARLAGTACVRPVAVRSSGDRRAVSAGEGAY
ncbi:hypothetical protein ACFCP7_28825, partial [Paenibacillus elgii]